MIGRVAEDRAAKGLKRWSPDEGMQGSVVFIGSVSSQGNRGQISYASTKAGLEGAAATIMKEAMYYGVRCSVIHPGFTDTPMVRAMGTDYVAKNIPPYTQLGRLIQAGRDRRRDLLHARQLGCERRAVGRCGLARPGLSRARERTTTETSRHLAVPARSHEQDQQARPHDRGRRPRLSRPGGADDGRPRADRLHHRLWTGSSHLALSPVAAAWVNCSAARR